MATKKAAKKTVKKAAKKAPAKKAVKKAAKKAPAESHQGAGTQYSCGELYDFKNIPSTYFFTFFTFFFLTHSCTKDAFAKVNG